MKSGSLRVRLLLAAALSIVVALVAAQLSLMTLFERHVERRTEQELDNHLRHILALIEPDDDGRLIVPAAMPDPRFELPLSGLYWQIIENGAVVAASPSLGDETLTLPPPAPVGSRPLCVDIPGPRGKTVVLVVRDATVKFNEREHRLRLAAALDHAEVDAAVSSFGWEQASSLAILGVCLIGAAWAQVLVGLKPLEALRRRLVAVRSGSEMQLVGNFPDEVKPLVDDLNALIENQRQSVVRARARAGDLAHGLKTPLTALNSISRDLDARGDRRASAEISALVDRMQSHVGRELSRAQIAARQDRPASALLYDCVQQLVDALRRAPRGNAIEWILEVDRSAIVAMDQDDLAEVLGNLLENGLKWAKSTVRVRAYGVEPEMIIVEDDGPGVPADKLEMIRVRGERLDEARDGSGLGLAIVSDVIDAYGYRLELTRSELGGLEARIGLNGVVGASSRGRPAEVAAE